jgi:NAD(P)H-hydrate epimerase
MKRVFTFENLNIAIPKRKSNSHKGINGRVLVIAGSNGLGGAGIMASEASLYSGAGLVDLYTHESNVEASLIRNPEVMTLGISKFLPISENFNVILYGPGMQNDEWSNKMLQNLHNLPQESKLIIDAEGLQHLKDQNLTISNKTILTPHPGEASNLLDIPIPEIQKNREETAKIISEKFNVACVILKGNKTVVYFKDKKETFVCENGGPELSTGGTGDILCGVISSLLAQSLSLFEACLLSVAVHAKAGEIYANKYGEIGLNATALIPIIRKLLNK